MPTQSFKINDFSRLLTKALLLLISMHVIIVILNLILDFDIYSMKVQVGMLFVLEFISAALLGLTLTKKWNMDLWTKNFSGLNTENTSENDSKINLEKINLEKINLEKSNIKTTLTCAILWNIYTILRLLIVLFQ